MDKIQSPRKHFMIIVKHLIVSPKQESFSNFFIDFVVITVHSVIISHKRVSDITSRTPFPFEWLRDPNFAGRDARERFEPHDDTKERDLPR